ncbi:DMT family transporter [Actinomyces oris]|uniref:DMT family transporter n=1 Tax=Actinomyces oris TaxID=544580 RepID=UPI003D2EBAE4
MVFSNIEISRTSRAWGALLCAVVSEVSATLALKKALEVPEYYTVVLIGYALSFVFLSLVLRLGMALGVAYGIWGALGVALTSVLSVVLFGEPINITAVVGISFIVLGVLLVELGSQSHSASEGKDSTE